MRIAPIVATPGAEGPLHRGHAFRRLHRGDRATGESYCIAHDLFTEDDGRKLMVAWLRYGDMFVKLDGIWLFAERSLYVDWTETRASHP
jgi:hypothetical protein